MEILFVLIPVSLLIVTVSLVAFVWSVHNNQYEDLEKEAERILFDDPVMTQTTTSKKIGRAGGKEEPS
ncbi:MAG: cbb3-type cytochrome oxidase assembly protein CcoS [Proteobacteria bacterium]|nr:cbb3-type cytochrome oxidase assembly protein CcoS [Pseudomonadota bacterium]